MLSIRKLKTYAQRTETDEVTYACMVLTGLCQCPLLWKKAKALDPECHYVWGESQSEHQVSEKGGSPNLAQNFIFLMLRTWEAKVSPRILSANYAPKEKNTLFKPLQTAKQPTSYPFLL